MIRAPEATPRSSGSASGLRRTVVWSRHQAQSVPPTAGQPQDAQKSYNRPHMAWIVQIGSCHDAQPFRRRSNAEKALNNAATIQMRPTASQHCPARRGMSARERFTPLTPCLPRRCWRDPPDGPQKVHRQKDEQWCRRHAPVTHWSEQLSCSVVRAFGLKPAARELSTTRNAASPAFPSAASSSQSAPCRFH